MGSFRRTSRDPSKLDAIRSLNCSTGVPLSRCSMKMLRRLVTASSVNCAGCWRLYEATVKKCTESKSGSFHSQARTPPSCSQQDNPIVWAAPHSGQELEIGMAFRPKRSLFRYSCKQVFTQVVSFMIAKPFLPFPIWQLFQVSC